MEKRKPAPRLKHFDYLGQYAYSITINTYNRTPYFCEKRKVSPILSVLKQVSQQSCIEVYVYCFMPDHVHLLLTGQENSNLLAFVKLFKQNSSYIFKRTYGGVLWQRGYYDHVLRKEETLRDVAQYILNNPVRYGLVNDCKAYPYPGSLLLKRDQFKT